MTRDGKQLENLVRQIEELLLPQGLAVTSNRKVFNYDGVTVAEFDVEINGRVGSADMSWLIECRDRAQPAPASWIEQLVGRQRRFGFNKVMAVSTSGFAPGAVAYAKEACIELRAVAEMNIDELPKWLELRHMTQVTRKFLLRGARLVPSDDESPERLAALRRRLGNATGDTKLLHAIGSGDSMSLPEAFMNAIGDHDEAKSGLEPNGPGKEIKARVRYPNDDSHFVVETDAGPVRIRDIFFTGDVSLVEQQIPFDALKEYRRDATNETISQTVTFPLELEGSKFALEMHNLADTGETHVLLRKLS